MLMKVFIVAIAIIFCFSAFVQAGTFMDLEPGASIKKDVDKALGTPIKEIVKNERYDYDVTEHDAKRISVSYDSSSGKVKSIFSKISCTAKPV